ncbi:hypothetical protein WMF45_30910 [Sorangium sp. So ce448]|uniref:hypothetical protein n=1 Tax=Sorangium sp. So ce448 TaxID=3133314 RepID=UPI003F5F972C
MSSRPDPSSPARGDRPQLWLGDALRAIRALGVHDPEEARSICALVLGTDTAAAERRDAAPPSSIERLAPPVPLPKVEVNGVGVIPEASGAAIGVPSQLVEIHRPPADEETGAARSGSVTALALETAVEWRKAPEPLFRTPVERSILREIAAALLPSARIDVDRLVESMAKLDLPLVVPFLDESTTRRGVQFLVDRSARLDGFAFDMRQIKARFVSLLGGASVETLQFHEFPSTAGPGPSDTWTRYRAPAPFVPIVVVTAFSTVSARAWEALVARWAREQRYVTFLVPHGAERVPPRVAAAARVVLWDRATTARSARRSKPARPAMAAVKRPGAERHDTDPLDRLWRRNRDAARLARYASLAAHVEPALLRELRHRLLPDATPAAELDLWTSDVASSKTRDGFTLSPRVLDRLRREAAASGKMASVLAIVKRLHAGAPPLLQLEERLIALSLGPSGQLMEQRIQSELEPVLAAMERSSARTKNLAGWFARTVARLPPAVVSSDVGRLLGFVAASHVPGAAAVKALPSEGALRRAAALLPKEREVAIGVRWRTARSRTVLDLVRFPETGRAGDAWHVLHVTKCDPLVVWVDDRPISVGSEPVEVDLSAPEGEPITRIRDISGKRWELASPDDRSHAVAVVRGRERQGIAYLVDADLCMTAIYAVDTDEVHLQFPWGKVRGRVVARGKPAIHWAMIRLDAPVTLAPLVLGADLRPDDAWEIAASASLRMHGRGSVLLRNDVGMRLPIAQPITDHAKAEAMRGAPVFVGGHVAGHVAFVDPPGDGQGIVVCPSSALRAGWAASRITSVPGVEQRLAAAQDSRDEPAPGIAVGRRTFLFADVLPDETVVRPRWQYFRQARCHSFGEHTWLAVSITEDARAGRFIGFGPAVDLWAGSSRPDVEAAPGARTPHVFVDFLRTSYRPAFVCVPADGEGFELLPYPLLQRDGEAPQVINVDMRRIDAGLPVFVNGHLVGVTLPGHFPPQRRLAQQAQEPLDVPEFVPLRTIFDVVSDLAVRLLQPRDWTRLARRLREDRLADDVTGDLTQPHAVLAAIRRSGSRDLLQFALDQSIRRLEAGVPPREPSPWIRAELDIEKLRSAGSTAELAIRLSIVDLSSHPAASSATYTLDTPLMEDMPSFSVDRQRGFPIEVVVPGDCDVSVEVGREPVLDLRARLGDLLDEKYLYFLRDEPWSRNWVSDEDIALIEDAIDDLRRR